MLEERLAELIVQVKRIADVFEGRYLEADTREFDGVKEEPAEELKEEKKADEPKAVAKEEIKEEVKEVKEAEVKEEVKTEKGPAVTLEEVRKLALEKSKTVGKPVVNAAIQEAGASKLSQVDPERYGELLEKLKGL